MKTLTISAPDALFDQAVQAVCNQYGYQPTLPDGSANPQSATDFAKAQLILWIRHNIEADAVKQATAAVDAARQQIQQTLDTAASSIVATVG